MPHHLIIPQNRCLQKICSEKLICSKLKSQLGAYSEIYYFQSFGIDVFLKGSDLLGQAWSPHEDHLKEFNKLRKQGLSTNLQPSLARLSLVALSGINIQMLSCSQFNNLVNMSWMSALCQAVEQALGVQPDREVWSLNMIIKRALWLW